MSAAENGHKAGVPVSRHATGKDAGTATIRPVRFAEMAPPGQREYLIGGIMPKAHTTVMYADGGSAKSVLALSLGTALAAGAATWLGREAKGCPVLYADFELDQDEQRRRAYQVARGVGLDRPPHDLLYVSALGKPAGTVLHGCLRACKDEGVGLLILDSLGIALEGDAESARDVIRFYRDYLEPFKAQGVSLLVVDHQPKPQAGERYGSKTIFGSAYKANLARSVLQVEPTKRREGDLRVRVRHTKSNFGPRVDPFDVGLRFTDQRITAEPLEPGAAEMAGEPNMTAADRVLRVLKGGPGYPSDIAREAELPPGTTSNALTKLRKDGHVEPTGERHPETAAERVQIVPVPPSRRYTGRDGGTLAEKESA